MNTEIFASPPVLQTPRLRLEPLDEGDAGLVFRFNADPEALRHVPREPFREPAEGEAKLAWFLSVQKENGALWWKFVIRENDVAIGYGGVFDVDRDAEKAEVGYGLLQEHWGRGYAGEAAAAMVDCAFGAMGLHRVYAKVEPGNGPSARILERLGFVREGRLRDDAFARGRRFDMDLFARLAGDPAPAGA